MHRLLVRPEILVFEAHLCFTADVFENIFYLCQRDISKLRPPIAAKFCRMISSGPNFIMPVQNFEGGLSQKYFMGQKHAKFGPISNDFKLRRRISLERMKTFKLGQVFDLLNSACVRCLPTISTFSRKPYFGH